MPLELIQDQLLTKAADVYSFGVLVYEVRPAVLCCAVLHAVLRGGPAVATVSADALPPLSCAGALCHKACRGWPAASAAGFASPQNACLCVCWLAGSKRRERARQRFNRRVFEALCIRLVQPHGCRH